MVYIFLVPKPFFYIVVLHIFISLRLTYFCRVYLSIFTNPQFIYTNPNVVINENICIVFFINSVNQIIICVCAILCGALREVRHGKYRSDEMIITPFFHFHFLF